MGANRIFHCEYSGKAEGPGYELWREQFARRWLSADFGPLAGDRFVNEVSATEHSFLGLCKMRSTPVRIERRSDAAAPGTRYVIVAAGSPLRTHQRGRFVDLLPGEMSLLSADEPAQLDHLSDGDRWSIRMPHKLLGGVCKNVDDRISRPTGAPRDLTRLLLHQVEVAHRFGSKLDASANHMIAQHLLDLIALCFGAKGDAAHVAGHRGLAAARVDAIKAEILQRLANPNLTLTRIATRFGLSTRYVQYLFELPGRHSQVLCSNIACCWLTGCFAILQTGGARSAISPAPQVLPMFLISTARSRTGLPRRPPTFARQFVRNSQEDRREFEGAMAG